MDEPKKKHKSVDEPVSNRRSFPRSFSAFSADTINMSRSRPFPSPPPPPPHTYACSIFSSFAFGVGGQISEYLWIGHCKYYGSGMFMMRVVPERIIVSLGDRCLDNTTVKFPGLNSDLAFSF